MHWKSNKAVPRKLTQRYHKPSCIVFAVSLLCSTIRQWVLLDANRIRMEATQRHKSANEPNTDLGVSSIGGKVIVNKCRERKSEGGRLFVTE